MRLAEDEIRRGIVHPERLARDAALRYFGESFIADAAVMPVAIEAIEAHGWRDAFRFGSSLANLAQSEETLLWSIDQLNRLGRPRASEDVAICGRLSAVIANAEVSLLMKHEAKVLGLEYLEPQSAGAIAERLRLLAVDIDECWRELEWFCAENEGKKFVADVDLPHAERVVEAIARDEASAERVLTLLSRKIDDHKNNPMAWMEAMAVRAAGLMRLEAAVPMIAAMLMRDCSDHVRDESISALARIGSDATVETICKDFPAAPRSYKVCAAAAMEHMRSDAAVSKCLDLLEQEKAADIRVSLIAALLGGFSSDGIGPARELCLHGKRGLRGTLVGTAMLMGAPLPELERWKVEEQREAEEDRQAMARITAAPAPKAQPKLPPFGQAIQPPIARGDKVGRNDPCPCGSGKKYKKCCMGKE